MENIVSRGGKGMEENKKSPLKGMEKGGHLKTNHQEKGEPPPTPQRKGIKENYRGAQKNENLQGNMETGSSSSTGEKKKKGTRY